MSDGTAYEYTYGENNELREIRLPGTGSITYPSYTWTRPDAVLYPGGGRREYDYDPLMRITRILAKDPGKNIVLDYLYTYDNMDNILSKQTGQGTYNYTYDALYRLTDVQIDIPGQENEGFGYDAVGNRLSEDGVEGEWSYNDNNELLTFATTEYTYDANGNATQLLLDDAVMFTYHYNAQDRLVQVEDVNGNVIAEYYYDPFGRRLWKDVGGTKTYFFYADEGLVAEYDASGLEIRTYGYRPDSTWTTDPFWLKQGGEYYFYQNDHLGTSQKLTSITGAVVWSATYTSFGEATVDPASTVTNNLRFAGQLYDEETGLHYNRFRYYEPKTGRYIKDDPIGILGGTNFYVFVFNNPIVFIDNSGLYPFQNFIQCVRRARNASVQYAQTDDLRHCFASCEIATNCGLGTLGSAFIGVSKEIVDVFGPGNAEFRDLLNNTKGNICASTGIHPSIRCSMPQNCQNVGAGQCAACCSCLKQSNLLN